VAITNGYATLAEVKAALRIPSADTIDDTLIELAIESSSRALDTYTGRYFYNAGTATRYFVADSNYYTVIDDAITITEVATADDLDAVYDNVWTSVEYQKEPLNGVSGGITGWPTTALRAVDDKLFPVNSQEACVKITGTWGWSAVPIAVKQATILQAARVFKRNESPLGVLSSPDLGFIRVGTRIDPDVAMLVDPYRTMRQYY
jgi:hypothetical protein